MDMTELNELKKKHTAHQTTAEDLTRIGVLQGKLWEEMKTELQTLIRRKRAKEATSEELIRLKELQTINYEEEFWRGGEALNAAATDAIRRDLATGQLKETELHEVQRWMLRVYPAKV